MVRLATPGETLQTLDGAARELVATDLVIADAARAVALAGVMGGLATEVTAKTRRVLLESAHFDRSSVRRTAKRLGLHTDASHRFERGTDPEQTVAALDRAAVLLADLAGASVRRGALDVVDPSAFARREIAFSPSRLDAFAGVAYDRSDLQRWFQRARARGRSTPTARSGRCGCRAGAASTSSAPRTSTKRRCASAASTRSPPALPPVFGSDGPETPVQRRRRLVRRHLIGQGFAETIQLAFVSRDEDARYPLRGRSATRAQAGPVELANPLSEQLLGAAALDAARVWSAPRTYNLRRGAAALRLFEIGHVFLDAGGRVARASPRRHRRHGVGRRARGRPVRSQGRGRLAARGVRRHGRDPSRRASRRALRHRRRALSRGRVGGLVRSPRRGVGGSALRRRALLPRARRRRLGAARGDAVEVPRRRRRSHAHALARGAVGRDRARRSPAPLRLVLQEFGLKDRYQGEGVPEGAVNTTIFFRYNAPDRTLQQEEVNAHQAELAGSSTDRFGWAAAKETA